MIKTIIKALALGIVLSLLVSGFSVVIDYALKQQSLFVFTLIILGLPITIGVLAITLAFKKLD